MEKYVLENDKLRAVIREKSAELISLRRKDNDQEYLWNADKKFWGWTSPVLFPAVGGFRDDVYRYQGKTYEMEKHGFARRTNFHLDSKTDTEIWMSIEDTEETYRVYPFHFRFEVGFCLKDNTLDVIWRVINKDEGTMYFALGGHPALLCPLNGEEGARTECYLGLAGEKETAAMDYLMVDPVIQRIDDKKLHKFELENQLHRITKGMFDHDALIFEDYQVKTAFLAGADRKPYIKMHTETPIIAFWSPEEAAPFICFEPWCGRGDSVDFEGTLEERAWEQSVEGQGTYEQSYQLEVVL
ncbi:MAG: aldose 1-epimerase family protein [Clostridiales bacterium]|nr:aldose 1-epimerase family protein [Clostridiales bacterium]